MNRNSEKVYKLDIIAYNQQLRLEYERTTCIEVLEKYVVSETIPPIADYENAVKIIRSNYGRQVNASLLIIGAFIASGWTSEKNELLAILNEMREYLEPKEKAITSFLNAHDLYLRDKNYKSNPEYEAHLLDSLKYDGPFVRNRRYLAELYTGRKASAFHKDAISNVVKVFSEADSMKMSVEQLADPQRFIEEHIMGTHITYVNYEMLREDTF